MISGVSLRHQSETSLPESHTIVTLGLFAKPREKGFAVSMLIDPKSPNDFEMSNGTSRAILGKPRVSHPFSVRLEIGKRLRHLAAVCSDSLNGTAYLCLSHREFDGMEGKQSFDRSRSRMFVGFGKETVRGMVLCNGQREAEVDSRLAAKIHILFKRHYHFLAPFGVTVTAVHEYTKSCHDDFICTEMMTRIEESYGDRACSADHLCQTVVDQGLHA